MALEEIGMGSREKEGRKEGRKIGHLYVMGVIDEELLR
jgi:hypothetical protein